MCFIPAYIFILFAIIIIDYFAAILMEKTSGKKRKIFLILSIVGNIGILVLFKYYNFFSDILINLTGFLHINLKTPAFNLLLPLGLSFHTFQSLSYTIDVYKGKQKAEKHPGIFALFVMFYPQLVAGPIERAEHMLPQFHEKHEFDSTRLLSGIKLMIWGFFMKVVIADRLALFVNTVFDRPHHFVGFSFVIAIVFFAFQIYCDFAGYSLIAIGSARTMGFNLMENFNRPYTARSVRDFWKRWHISLSSWFKDYVYIPLGGSRKSLFNTRLNTLTTFLLSGLWHGAGWNYILWGIINGLYVISGKKRINNLSRQERRNSKPDSFLKISWQVGTTFALTCFAWIFFRATNLSDALYIIKHLLWNWNLLGNKLHTGQLFFLNQPKSEFIIAVSSIIFLLAAEWWIQKRKAEGLPAINNKYTTLAWVALVFIIFLLGEFRAQSFIYFQF